MRSNAQSAALFERGRAVVTDGVSSPMRAFGQVGGNPICAASASGSTITDVDGNRYVDFLNAFGALILGHAREEVVEAISRQARRGTVYGLCTELEYELAEKLVHSTPALDQVRFVCSGTEAVMTVARIARSHTGRDLLVKFRGSYHGHSDALLASPNESGGAVGNAKGVSQGLPQHLHREVLLCDYNDVEQLSAIFAAHGNDIAAVLVEPFATNMGFVAPQPGFLQHIRSLCDRHGALFIADEVVTGFRFAFGPVCSTLDVDPDLLTFGKIIGGGAPIGAFGGKARYMRNVAQGGRVFQSGTFAANPLTLAAANATLDVLSGPGFYADMERRGALLEQAITASFAELEVPYLFRRHGALSGVAFRDSRVPMRSLRDVKTQQYDVYKVVHARMRERGFLMAPSLEEPIFISAAHSDEDLLGFARALAESIVAVRSVTASAPMQASATGAV